MNFVKQHVLLIVVLLVVIIGAAWYEFTSNSGPQPVLTTTGIATDTQDADLVSTLLQLQAVTLSGTVFSDPGFLSLQDYTTQITSEPIGRPNPFAPLSSTSTASEPQTKPIDPNLFAPKESAQ